MGILSVGRGLVIRQLLLAALVLALGGYAFLAMHGIESMVVTMAAEPKADADTGAILAAARAASWHLVLITGGAVLVMLAWSIPVIHFMIGTPIRVLAEAGERIAAGDLSTFVTGESRKDEIGSLARALRQLRDAIAELEDRAQRAKSRAEPLGQHHARLTQDKVEKFALDLTVHLNRLGQVTKRLSEASGTMIVAAKHATDGSDKATSASVNAAGDVSSVATASEQLLDSIEEISRQVVQSTNVVKATVQRAVDTNAGMGRLSTAAQKVGDVVSLISRIAAQTNLLALNATIEAARAGEAGRGFAVVAQEVKTLATQTAKATQDITGQIAEMQEATDKSVEAIDKIQSKISEVEHISTIIAAAVHEQGAATQEITRNVRSAAAGTTAMSSHIENVVRSVVETSGSAETIGHIAQELDEIAGGIGQMVGSFAKTMKAA